MTVAGPAIDGARMLDRLERLARIGATSGGGVTRLAWSPEMDRATDLVSDWSEQAGATVVVDPVGNLIAELPGTEAGLPPVVTGSHLDTVVDAGPLDGAYGVVAGVEVLAALQRAGVRLRHPLRVVAYANEEGLVAPAFTGSRAIAGILDTGDPAGGPCASPSRAGPTLAGPPHAGRLPTDPEAAAAARWPGPVAATVELHIEQGPVLDSTGPVIGVVTAITGQQRGTITITGAANHAGTTPMDMRHDALVAAARAVLAIRSLAVDGLTEVATAGRLDVSPNAANVVPGRCQLSFDIRSPDAARIGRAVEVLGANLDRIAAETRTSITVDAQPPTAPAPTDAGLRTLIARAAAARGLPSTEMTSGAGHDCANLARLGPIAMIFVPSIAGVSHHPGEATDPAHLVAGAEVLLDTLLALDRQLTPAGSS